LTGSHYKYHDQRDWSVFVDQRGEQNDVPVLAEDMVDVPDEAEDEEEVLDVIDSDDIESLLQSRVLGGGAREYLVQWRDEYRVEEWVQESLLRLLQRPCRIQL
jgi:hypothetical protein